MELDDITGGIIESAIEIHRDLGPGLLEPAYEVVLGSVLEQRGLNVARQCPVGFHYRGIEFANAFRADLVVEGAVVVEVKSVERIAAVHPKQLLTYLRLMKLDVGLLLNFGAPMMKEGIKRVVNDLSPFLSPRLRVNQSRIDHPIGDTD